VLGAVLVAVVGFPLAILLLWVAAWNWGPWQQSDRDRRKLVTGAAAVAVATFGLMVLIVRRGFRDPDR
jgi:nitrate reductase gamma subunit